MKEKIINCTCKNLTHTMRVAYDPTDMNIVFVTFIYQPKNFWERLKYLFTKQCPVDAELILDMEGFKKILENINNDYEKEDK